MGKLFHNLKVIIHPPSYTRGFGIRIGYANKDLGPPYCLSIAIGLDCAILGNRSIHHYNSKLATRPFVPFSTDKWDRTGHPWTCHSIIVSLPATQFGGALDVSNALPGELVY